MVVASPDGAVINGTVAADHTQTQAGLREGEHRRVMVMLLLVLPLQQGHLVIRVCEQSRGRGRLAGEGVVWADGAGGRAASVAIGSPAVIPLLLQQQLLLTLLVLLLLLQLVLVLLPPPLEMPRLLLP